jgi:competence protein ComGC
MNDTNIGSRSGFSLVYEEFINSVLFLLLIAACMIAGAVNTDIGWTVVGLVLWVLRLDDQITRARRRLLVHGETVFLSEALMYALKLDHDHALRFLRKLVDEGYIREETLSTVLENTAEALRRRAESNNNNNNDEEEE